MVKYRQHSKDSAASAAQSLLQAAATSIPLRNGIPWSDAFSDHYWSGSGQQPNTAPDPVAEKQWVFLQGNRLADRWRRLKPGARFCIGEIGFGTGLNLLCTWRLWQQLAPPGCRLDYLAFDLSPPHVQTIRSLHADRPGLIRLTQRLLRCGLPHTGGIHRLSLESGARAGLRLTLAIGDAAEQLRSLLQHWPLAVDAWFLDAFTPANNPSGWSDELLQLLAQASAPDATVASYSAAGAVRNGLQASGFEVHKEPGYGIKRHRLTAQLCKKTSPQTPSVPTPSSYAEAGVPQQAVVVGAGLAGAFCARSLAERGCRVLLLEAGASPGGGASANPAALLRPRLNAGTPLQQLHWSVSGWQLALHKLASCSAWKPTGVLQHLPSPRSLRRAQKLNQLRPSGEFGALKTAAEASDIAGVDLTGDWLFHRQAGWVDAARLSRQLTAHANIELRCGHRLAAAEPGTEAQWSLQAADGSALAETDLCILATGSLQGLQLPVDTALPQMRQSTGLMLRIAADAHSESLAVPLCGCGTLLPASRGGHWMGFSRSGHSPASLFAGTSGLPPDFASAQGIAAHLVFEAVRHYSPSRLPTVSRLHRGMYTIGGLGSRGLTLAPLAAEYLASRLFAEPPPVGSLPLPAPLSDLNGLL